MNISARHLIVLASLAILATLRVASAQPIILIGDDLSIIQGELVSIDSARIVFVDESATRRERSIQSTLALVPADWFDGDRSASSIPDLFQKRTRRKNRASSQPIDLKTARNSASARMSTRSVIELVDGVRFRGRLSSEVSDDPERVAWEASVYGRISIPLDRIRRMTVMAQGDNTIDPPESGQISDEVILVNGDRIAGFLESIDASVHMDVDGSPVSLSLDLVSEIRLVNPLLPIPPMVIWIDDGAVLPVSSLANVTGKPDLISAPLAASGVTNLPGSSVFPSSDLVAVAWDNTRLRALGSCTIESQQTTGARRRLDAVSVAPVQIEPLGIGDIHIPGPMKVTWQIPADAQRLAGRIRLPSDAWTWGDCRIRIEGMSSNGMAQLLFSTRLNGASPQADVNVDLRQCAGNTLSITIEEGEYGPIQDRITLRRFMLLLNQPGM